MCLSVGISIFVKNPLDISSFENKCAKHKGAIKMNKTWTLVGHMEKVIMTQSRNKSMLHATRLSPPPEMAASVLYPAPAAAGLCASTLR